MGRPDIAYRLSRRTYAIGVTLVFGVFTAVVLGRHEPWSDELQAWSIADSSRSLTQLWDNRCYEGHPILWHLILFGVHLITSDPLGMQVVHLALGMATVFVLARFAPFGRVVTAALAFSYLTCYEYTVISRDYGIGELSVFVFCALYPTRRRSFLPLASTLFVMAQTNPMALLLVPAFSVLLLADLIAHDRARVAMRRRDIAGSAAVVLAGVALALLEMRTPADGEFSYATRDSWGQAVAAVWRGYVPVPRLGTEHFWDTNVLDGHVILQVLQVLLGATLLVVTSLALRRDRPVLLTFWLGSAALILFFKFVYSDAERQRGYLFVLLISCLWLARHDDNGARPVDRFAGIERAGLGLVLVGQVAALVIACSYDLRIPFSNARGTAELVQARGLADHPIIGDSDARTSSVSAELGKPFYFPRERAWRSYVVWSRARRDVVSQADLVASAAAIYANRHESVVLVLNYPLTAGAGTANSSITRIGVIGRPAIVASEQHYYLYVYGPRHD